MAKFYLPVSWEVCGVVTVEAANLEEAIEYFNENTDEIELPAENDYVDGSFCLSTTETDDLRFMHEDEKKRREGA